MELTKNVKTFNLKAKIINILMKSGRKNTGEKIILKFMKKLQKLSTKQCKTLLHLAIINSTPAFNLNEQVVKKGKRKAVKSIPSFITSDSSRIMTSVKLIKQGVVKTKTPISFYKKLAHEIFLASNLRGQSVEKKTLLQQQILANKRYLSKFRW